VGRYFGREPRYSREELELQAKQAIEAAVNMGRPPAEDFAPIEARLAELDREMAARAPVVAMPLPPRQEAHPPISVTEVRLPAAAKAGRPVRATATAAPKPRAPRKPVAAKER
jgi:hypothetical protein